MTKKLYFTDKAKDQIKKITSESKSKKYFRVSVKVVDVLDLNTALVLTTQKKDDDVEFGNALIDKTSTLEIINGSTIDFKLK